MKDSDIVFYVNNFKYLESSADSKIDFVPAILRRRMSKMDKCLLSVLNNVFTPETENIVFSSQYGEVERLLKIIEQYTKNNEVSPNMFSGSVHNFAIGFYLLNIKKTIPYTALAACENSISAGFLSSVIANYNNNIFCYADICGEDFISMAVNITKIPQPGSCKFVLKPVPNSGLQDNFKDYTEFFSGMKTKLNTSLFSIERGSND